MTEDQAIEIVTRRLLGLRSCIAIGKEARGRYTWLTVGVYREIINAKGLRVWRKGDVIDRATTQAKVERLAAAAAQERGIPLLPHVRHNDLVSL